MDFFEYYSPNFMNEACKLLDGLGPDVRILAGGTDLLIELRKTSIKTPKAIVDISRIQELRGIKESGDSIIIKPLTTHTEIMESALVQQYAPLLRQAASMIGSPQIRNRGTIGGNIMNAATCADTVPPLIALGASVTLRSVRGDRVLPVADFFIQPYKTIADPKELLTEISFPKLHDPAKCSFIKLGRRNALSISRLSVAAVLRTNDSGIIQEARIVPGAAFPRWQRVTGAENLLLGKKSSEELFMEAGKKVSELMISFTGRRWSTEYKEPVIAVLVRRALEMCA